MADPTNRQPEEGALPPLSRRRFLQGVAAAGATVSAAGYLFRQATTITDQTPAPGAVDRVMTITVNGQQRHVDVPPHETLAMTLRRRLGLTGTKVGCERAECGSCTVLIDGIPHYSCSILTHSVRERSVTTIEGLVRADGTLHPVQQAFVDEQGMQCGFCTPGFIMATVGFLETNPEPTREELAHGISGNLCRCQDYDKILTAAMRAAEYTRLSVASAL